MSKSSSESCHIQTEFVLSPALLAQKAEIHALLRKFFKTNLFNAIGNITITLQTGTHRVPMRKTAGSDPLVQT